MTAFLQPDPIPGPDNAQNDPAALAVVDPALLSLLMDEFSLGVVIIARSGRIEYINRAARTELDDARVLSQSLQAEVPTLHATAHNPRAQAQLDDALALAAAGRRSLVSLHGDDGPLDVVVLPFAGQPGAAEPLYALYFVRTNLCASPMLNLFARSHRLTLTEQNVLAALCRGHTMPEIAAQLGVAPSTVRTHVRHLCTKTGATSVRELVYLMAVLPPVEPTPPREH